MFVVDGDIQGFVDTIDEAVPMEPVGRRVCDRRMLKLLRQWPVDHEFEPWRVVDRL